MSDPPSPAEERAEAAATRRRWITLAELVGVAGLVIAGLSLWMSWSDRRADEQAKRAEQVSESKARTLVAFIAQAAGGGDRLVLKDAAHPVQSIDVTFPAALGIARQTSLVEPRIEGRWIAAPLLALTDKGADKQRGRVPVLITASYWDADIERHDSAIYDVVWRTEGRMFQGRALRLEGLMLRERTASAKRLDAIWASERPAPVR